jgi:hypothetical protein
MPVMAKKKKPPETPPPAPSGEKSDRHMPRGMIGLPAWLHEMIQDQARKEEKPLTWLIKRLIVDYLKSKGKEIPPDID